ncbi:hypothetical protein U1Q18_020343 [Sarracenia purpurea var. burkii]
MMALVVREGVRMVGRDADAWRGAMRVVYFVCSVVAPWRLEVGGEARTGSLTGGGGGPSSAHHLFDKMIHRPIGIREQGYNM